METTPIRPFQVARDGDRHAAHRKVGIGTLFFKVTTADSNGAFLVVEIAHHAKGGPPRHLHRDQDEWFHVTEGAYIVEIGDERYLLGPGDSATTRKMPASLKVRATIARSEENGIQSTIEHSG